MRVILAFCFGALLSGYSVFSVMDRSHESAIVLHYVGSNIADLKEHMWFLNKDQTDIKCTIAYAAVNAADALENTEVEQSYIYNAPGLPGFIERNQKGVLSDFEKQGVRDLLNECRTN